MPTKADPAQKQKLVAIGKQLDEYYDKTVKEVGATGAAVGIVVGGELVYGRGFGTRSMESKDAVTADSVFRIASVTKSFTALAVMKLRDEGKLELDQAVTTYLPELVLDEPDHDAGPMTVRQLLSMSSGLPFDDMWGAVTFGMNDETFTKLMKSGITLATAPGEKYAYSNLGYALLGRIVERVSKLRFREYVNANILGPLEMKSSVWESSDVPSHRLVVGYRREKEKLVAEPRPSDGVYDAAGGLYASVNDYARYLALQLEAYPARAGAESGPVRRDTLREMHTGHQWARWRGHETPILARRPWDGELSMSAAAYGYGWLNNTTCESENIVQHGGFEPGYWTTVHLLPQHRVGIVTMSASAPLGWKAFAPVLEMLRDAGVLAARQLPVTPGLSKAREATTKLLERWDPKLLEAAFDPQSLKYSWLSSLKQDFEKLGTLHGRCKSAGGIKALSRSRGRWRLTCDHGAIELTVLLTPSNPPRIQMLEWKQELVPNEKARRVAKQLTALVSRWSEATGDKLFASGAEEAKRATRRLGVDHGECELDRAKLTDASGRTTLLLKCEREPLEMTFELDSTGKVTEVSGVPAREPGAPCTVL